MSGDGTSEGLSAFWNARSLPSLSRGDPMSGDGTSEGLSAAEQLNRAGRRNRQLRREMRREAFEFARENPGWTRESMQSHLKAEFCDMGDAAAFDPATLIALISAIIKLLEMFYNRD